MLFLRALIGSFFLLCAGTAIARLNEAYDANLHRTDGSVTRLSAYRGKPVVLFYEDRASTELNRPLKNQLVALRGTPTLLSQAHVVGIANLKRLDFFPVRHFAERAVRDVEQRVGVPVLIDWNGALSSGPWSLPAQGSTVVLLDRQGRVVFKHSGAMSADDIQDFFVRVQTLLEGAG